VTVTHSVVIKATGSTATEMDAFLEPIVVPFSRRACVLFPLLSKIEALSEPCIEDAGESIICPDTREFVPGASLLILDRELSQHGCEVRNYELRNQFPEVNNR
jgi:hypothetical protein